MKQFLLIVFLFMPNASQAAISVFTCEPEWASLVKEITANRAEIYSATTPFQDPHHLQARPSLIARIRNADLLVCTGADLEVGWLPLLLKRAGNSKLRPGEPGYFLASDHVRKLEIPTRIDRSEGDIHPQGNPHVHLDPRNVARISTALSAVIIRLDPDNRETYVKALESFTARWRAAQVTWRKQARSLKGKGVITHHRSFSYLVNWLGMSLIDTIEPKPGISPSSAHMSKLLASIEAASPTFILRTPFADPKPSNWLSGRTSIPALVLPYTVGEDHTATDLFQLFETSIGLLVSADES